jgi:hypothetical protein
MAGGGALRNLRLANHPVNSHQFNQHKGVRDLRLRGELHPHFSRNNSGIILRDSGRTFAWIQGVLKPYLFVIRDAHFLECLAKELEKLVKMAVI